MVCVTTETADLPVAKFEKAVEFLKTNLETCWEFCVAVSAEDSRYNLSMASFVGGFTFDAFEGTVHNLLACAEAIEKNYHEKME
jgi:hypothetical protein